MSLSLEEIGAIFCSDRKCSRCPFSENFKPYKFTKNMNIRHCIKACEDSAEQRALLWLEENGGADILLKKSSNSLGYCAYGINEIYNWCGYLEVDFL